MSLSDYKLTDAAVAQSGVVAAPDRLTGTAAQNKMIFDRLIRETVKPLFNGLIDELSGTGGAADVGVSVAGLAAQNVAAALYELLQKVSARATISALTAHTESTSNPHSVTKAQVGLGNCDNTSDANKPVSTATRAAIDALALELSAQDGATEIGASVEGLEAENVADALAELLGKIGALKTIHPVTIGRTSYNGISNALSQGKLPVIYNQMDMIELYWKTASQVHYFIGVTLGSNGTPAVETTTVDTSNHWSSGGIVTLATKQYVNDAIGAAIGGSY